MTTKRRPLSYTLHQSRADGHPTTVARLHCSKCEATLDIPIKSGDNHLIVVERAARKAEWLFNKNTARKCVCPECYFGTMNEAVNLLTAAPEEHVAGTSISPAGEIITIPCEELPQTAMAAAFVAAVQEIKPMPAPPATTPRGPTPAEKYKIRDFLDGAYDDTKKGYIDGWTDKRAAEKLNFPMAWIRDMREFAYGPLECDVEVSDLLDEIERVKRKQLEELASLEKRVRSLEVARR